MFRLLVLVASAAVAAGLLKAEGMGDGLRPARPTQAPRSHASRSVLILGCSVDRYAVEWFCGKYENFLRVACNDQARDLAVGFVFHPGVGYHGDLQPPFFNRTRYGNISSSIIGGGHGPLVEHSLRMVGEAQPDMVVVDSSLWDLANWASIDGQETPSTERLDQWCDHDLPNMLKKVRHVFNQSRVVFRTAPQVAKPILIQQTGVNQFSSEGIDYMNKCVKKHSGKGHMGGRRLFGMYDVIDYHNIMTGLMPTNKHRQVEKDPNMWLPDGYHPNKEPARLYMNEILRLMDLPPVAEKDWAQTAPTPVEVPKFASARARARPIGEAPEWSTREPPEWSTDRHLYDRAP